MSYSQAPPNYAGPKGYQAVSQSDDISTPGPSTPYDAAEPRTEGDADPEVSIHGIALIQKVMIANIETRGSMNRGSQGDMRQK